MTMTGEDEQYRLTNGMSVDAVQAFPSDLKRECHDLSYTDTTTEDACKQLVVACTQQPNFASVVNLLRRETPQDASKATPLVQVAEKHECDGDADGRAKFCWVDDPINTDQHANATANLPHKWWNNESRRRWHDDIVLLGRANCPWQSVHGTEPSAWVAACDEAVLQNAAHSECEVVADMVIGVHPPKAAACNLHASKTIESVGQRRLCGKLPRHRTFASAAVQPMQCSKQGSRRRTKENVVMRRGNKAHIKGVAGSVMQVVWVVFAVLTVLVLVIAGSSHGEVVMEEDESGALHINTSDPRSDPVFVNGVDVGRMFEVVERQQRVNEEQQRTNEELRATICRYHPRRADFTSISGLSTDSKKWIGGVLGPNGLIFGITYHAPSVLIIDPAANTADTTSIRGLGSGGGKWGGGVLAPNGLIYGFPSNANAVLIIDPITKTADTTTIVGLSGDESKWISGLLASNGLIYCIPNSSPSVLNINPETNTTDTTSIAELGGDCCKWHGGVQANNGRIYGIPRRSSSVLLIDPFTKTADTTTITGLGESVDKWYGGVLAPNGLIYGIPFRATSVLIINPATNTADTKTITGLSGGGKWIGGFLAPNGKIIGIPYSSTSVLIIDPATNNTDTTSTNGLSSSTGKCWDGVLASNDLIYGIPHNADSVLIIDPGC